MSSELIIFLAKFLTLKFIKIYQNSKYHFHAPLFLTRLSNSDSFTSFSLYKAYWKKPIYTERGHLKNILRQRTHFSDNLIDIFYAFSNKKETVFVFDKNFIIA